MKKNKRKILPILLIILSLVFIQTNAFGHSGRTDSNGGHKDNQNKSGLGSYHYHCGGHPAHLHKNGVCPYSSSKSSTSSSSKSTSSTSSSKSTSSSTETTSTAPKNIEASEIKINENINNMKVGESKKLTATITPDNAIDKNITWKSSNENIATVNSSGEVVAKKAGNVSITASTSNGKTNTIKMDIEEIKQEDKNEINNTADNENNLNNNTIINTSLINTNDVNNNTSSGISTISAKTTNSTTINSQDESDAVGVVIALGIIGGVGYCAYRKSKK